MQQDGLPRVLEPAFSTKGTSGPILVTVLGMVAEIERKFIRERQQAGIEAAKAKGIYSPRELMLAAATQIAPGVRPTLRPA